MRPFQLWLLTIAVFVGAMILAFVVGGLARGSRLQSRPELDPELAVAIETSRRTLPQFIEKLRSPPKSATSFAVKVSFIESGRAEMMWVDHLTRSAGGFDGVLADSPVVVSIPHKGDRVHVADADVVDWEVFYRSPAGELHEGAETDRVLRRRQAAHTLRYPPRMPSSQARFV